MLYRFQFSWIPRDPPTPTVFHCFHDMAHHDNYLPEEIWDDTAIRYMAERFKLKINEDDDGRGIYSLAEVMKEAANNVE